MKVSSVMARESKGPPSGAGALAKTDKPAMSNRDGSELCSLFHDILLTLRRRSSVEHFLPVCILVAY